MSNQQPPYGQPPQQPYGQQPQYQGQPPYGQQQYGGYPPPPPPSGSNKTILIVFTVVVVMVVLGAGLFVITRFTGGSDDTAGTTPVTSQPTSDAPSTPSDGGSPTEPANDTSPSAPATQPAQPCRGCMPGLTLNGAVKTLKSKGYTCKDEKILGIQCEKGNLGVTVHADYRNKAYVERISISGGSSARVKDCPQCIKGAIAALKQGLPNVLPWFVKDPAIRQRMVAFAIPGASIPDSGPNSARDLAFEGLYRVSTNGYSGATVGKGDRYSTYYSTNFYIRGYS
ncbi:hypothetical protein [Kribbella albertanoniae]|uniref:Uncharacterized protein n=1 Tax=Kribbella albertanoniae TaxID=1266829 RepID=A0A4R4Q809_9ACTN|nr:hypothetical protein [Kribbella albertanoniae]TDC31348.1 hypothetical protein E1261_11070 [Kribbella albertanoniae]